MRLAYTNTAKYVENHVHGWAPKTLAVLHETVSPDVPGLADILGVESYLASKDYGIHSMTDFEGNIAHARGYEKAIFWQCGGVNTESVGIEQVSTAPYPPSALGYWIKRQKQLRATAKLLAAYHNSFGLELKFSMGKTPGVTGHWCVSQWSPRSEGHRDCWPRHLGGNYPILSVIAVARQYAKTGITL